MRLTLFLMLFICQSVFASNNQQDKAKSLENVKPAHEQILERLKKSNAVIPWTPDIHPVTTVYNREASIPPQCYTRTEGKFNPCYTCHQNVIPGRENVMNDFSQQIAYNFSDLGTTNHWKNLFENKQSRIDDISDSTILDWVNQDNYSALADRLKQSDFDGWIPDLQNLHLAADAFGKDGFAKNGSHWVAFNYKPLPSTFWPTNGSTDDVMIRLPERFRTDNEGNYSSDIYRVNLTILEASIKNLKEISIDPVDENIIQVDLDNDNKLSITTNIINFDRYVGAASKLRPYSSLYPEGTEFLHTVRYLGIDENNIIRPSTRMKEVRYMRKWRAYSKRIYERYYELESFEKEAGNLPGYQNVGHKGLGNGFGWTVHGFIEGVDGELRSSTFEENMFCMGCHTTIGSTIDKTFSFARKIDGADGWGYIDLKGMQDVPNVGETKGEIHTYFERVGGGDEFRSNLEILQRWFNKDGSVNSSKVKAAKDVYDLIMPSRERALALNKAYRLIVEDQDYIYGRDAVIAPSDNVYQSIDMQKAPTLSQESTYKWDIRLDWSSMEGEK